MLKVLLAISIMLLASICIADEACEELAKKVMASTETRPNAWIWSRCKAKPDDPARSYLILNGRIFLVGTKDGQVFSQGGIESAASDIESIDTGRYWLAPKVRAFGIRFSRYQRHDLNSETTYSLNLYVVEGAEIRPVLENLYVGSIYSNAECNDKDECTVTTSSDLLAIEVARTSHHGFADLVLTSHGLPISDGILSYDGTRYAVPSFLLHQ